MVAAVVEVETLGTPVALVAQAAAALVVAADRQAQTQPPQWAVLAPQSFASPCKGKQKCSSQQAFFLARSSTRLAASATNVRTTRPR